MDKTVGVACLAGWKDVVLHKVKHAAVFLDSKMAELLHWVGGVGTLLDAGAEDVREFSSFESGIEGQKKGVFLVSSLLEGVTEQILHDIITQSHFQYVIVFTTAHPLMHSNISAAAADGGSAFEDFAELLQQWMGNMNYTAEVQHLNLFSCEVSPGFFITPAFSKLFPVLSSDLQQINYQYRIKQPRDTTVCDNLNDLEFSRLPDGLQKQIRMFAVGLDGLFQLLNVKEDIYSIGCLSRIIATELDSFPPAKTRRKNCQSRMSLILVDRSLDLASAITRQMDVLLDKMVNTLPSLSGHASDRHIDMSALCHSYRSGTGQGIVLPGCLAPNTFKDSPTHLISSVMKKQKEALMDINRKLVETASAEKLPLDLSRKPSRITAEQLESTLSLFKGKYPLIQKHLETLQVAMATSQTLKHPSSHHHDNMLAKEKNITQTIADSEGVDDEDDDKDSYPSAFSLLSKMLLSEMDKDTEERELTLDDFLHLLVYIYSLSDGSSEIEDEIKLLQDQMVQVVVQDKNSLPPLMQSIVGEKVTETILQDQMESLWNKLDSIMEARRDLKEFGYLVDPGGVMSPASIKPLLRQVIDKIVDPSKPELPDIECKSGGLKDLLKSGFGFFKSSAKPRPGDAPMLMVFVIGGVTASEVKQVKDIVNSAKPGFEVVVGSSRICSKESTLTSVLVTDNINIGET